MSQLPQITPGSLPVCPPSQSTASASLPNLVQPGGASSPFNLTGPLVPSTWQPQATAASAAGFPQLGQAMQSLALVLGSMFQWFQGHFNVAGAACSNCSSCCQGQVQRTCDQCEQILVAKLDKIANVLITLTGEIAGRLASVNPPGVQAPVPGMPPIGGPGAQAPGGGIPPIHAPVFPPAPIAGPAAGIGQPQGAGGMAGQPVQGAGLVGAGQPGYQPYNPPSLPQQGGSLTGSVPIPSLTPSGLTGGGGISPGTAQPDQLPQQSGQQTTSAPTRLPIGGGTPITIAPQSGPCTLLIQCIDINVANAIGSAIASAVGNMLRPLIPSIAPFIPQLPTTPAPAQQQPQGVRYKAPFQFESGPTIYTDSLDSWFEPDRLAPEGEITDDEGEEVV